MKALVDEQLSADIARELRRRGCDAEAVTERPDLVGASDQQLVELAAREDRAVITNNIRDFRPIAAQRLAQREGHAGLILLPSTRARNRAAIGRLVSATQAIMDANPDGIHSSERWIAPVSRAAESP
jgi:predicted nuclease of predicted toxin-antitoxin system